MGACHVTGATHRRWPNGRGRFYELYYFIYISFLGMGYKDIMLQMLVSLAMPLTKTNKKRDLQLSADAEDVWISMTVAIFKPANFGIEILFCVGKLWQR